MSCVTDFPNFFCKRGIICIYGIFSATSLMYIAAPKLMISIFDYLCSDNDNCLGFYAYRFAVLAFDRYFIHSFPFIELNIFQIPLPERVRELVFSNLAVLKPDRDMLAGISLDSSLAVCLMHDRAAGKFLRNLRLFLLF